MKAIIFDSFGGPEVLKVVEDYELPAKSTGEVRVKVHSTSVNPIDYKITESDQYGTQLPKVPGGDVAGIVDEDGEKLKKGDRIIALTDKYITHHDGSYSEYALVKEDWAVPAPKNLSLETEAAAVPLVSLTAFQALENARLTPGARVLIQAGSGGVGVFAVQLAKHLFDAFVVSTTGPSNVDFVKSLGADEVVNYREQDFAEVYQDPSKHFDAVIDCLGGDAEIKAYSVIKKGGAFVHIFNPGTDPSRVEEGKKWTDKRYETVFVQPNAQQLTKVVKLIEASKVSVPIAKVFPLEKAADGQKEVASGHTRGKIVLQVA